MSSIYQFSAQLNNGQEIKMEEFKGQPLLIVNTASKCGFTPQYAGLENLYQKYKDQGFKVLAFPCDQFGRQEPGSDESIKEFCDLQFNISFPLFKKVSVNGPDTLPLFDYLKGHARGVMKTRAIKWNFTKFLVNKEGMAVVRYAPRTKPEQLEQAIANLL